MLVDYAKISLEYMRHKKLRSWLTFIGIIIGVTTLISLITLAQGLENAVGKQFDKFGARRLMVSIKGVNTRGPPEGSLIADKDVEIAEGIGEVEYVVPVLFNIGELEYGSEKDIRRIGGFRLKNFQKAFSDLAVGLDSGRYLRDGDSRKVFLGYKLAKDVFDKEIFVKSRVKIQGVAFEVIGIQEELGDPNDDYIVYIPVEDAQDIFGQEGFSAMTFTVKKGVDVVDAALKIEKVYKRKRNDEQILVTDPQKIKEQAQQLLGVVKWVLIGISIISILVGAIGVMNSLFTSVLERTRDIGIMKSIGAKNADIMNMFLLESGFIGLFGGLVGVAVGSGISLGVDYLINLQGSNLLAVSLDWRVLVFGLVFSLVIGIVAGLIPAYVASRQKPVDSLRYE